MFATKDVTKIFNYVSSLLRQILTYLFTAILRTISMTQWCVMPPSPLPYQTLGQMEGRECTSVLAAERGWMEFRCPGYCSAEHPSQIAEVRQGPSHQVNRYSCDQRLELRAEICY